MEFISRSIPDVHDAYARFAKPNRDVTFLLRYSGWHDLVVIKLAIYPCAPQKLH